MTAKITKTKAVKKTKTVKTVKKTGLETDIFDVAGKATGKIELPKEIFAAGPQDLLLAQSVRVYLARQRQGTASTKTRGEVQGSTRKIYRQKGTGRARHGAIRAPIFVGGGIVFGPKPRNYDLKLPPKMRKKALKAALTGKFKDNDILVLSGLSALKGKTQEMIKILGNLKLEIKHGQLKNKILLITPGHEENIWRAGRNIQNLTLTPANLLNPYQLLTNQKIIFTQEALENLFQWKPKTS